MRTRQRTLAAAGVSVALAAALAGCGSDSGGSGGGSGELEVLPRLLEDQAPLVDHEHDRVGEDPEVEGDHVVLRALAHGVSARSASTRPIVPLPQYRSNTSSLPDSPAISAATP